MIPPPSAVSVSIPCRFSLVQVEFAAAVALALVLLTSADLSAQSSKTPQSAHLHAIQDAGLRQTPSSAVVVLCSWPD